MPEHDELESLVAGWVLGALEPGEVAGVRAHVEACPICLDTALRLRRVVGALPLEVKDVIPPAALRERILAAAAASRGPMPALVLPKTRTKQYRPSARATNLAGRTRRWVPAYAAAASVVLSLVVGLVAGDVIGRQAPAPTAVVRSALVGHQGLASARANVIDLKNDGVALVDFSGLPQLDSGRVYEIWLITAGGRADPAGVFVPDTNGSKFVLVGRSLAGYAQMAVTTEVGPDGTLAPTQQPELYGSLV
ncbi:MAG: anti-sigma factor [Candidatus Dormiibacterota bacterium]